MRGRCGGRKLAGLAPVCCVMGPWALGLDGQARLCIQLYRCNSQVRGALLFAGGAACASAVLPQLPEGMCVCMMRDHLCSQQLQLVAVGIAAIFKRLDCDSPYFCAASRPKYGLVASAIFYVHSGLDDTCVWEGALVAGLCLGGRAFHFRCGLRILCLTAEGKQSATTVCGYCVCVRVCVCVCVYLCVSTRTAQLTNVR